MNLQVNVLHHFATCWLCRKQQVLSLPYGLWWAALTHIVHVLVGRGGDGGCSGDGAAGGLPALGGFHLHVAALRLLAGRAGGVPDGGVGVLAVQGAGAGAAHGALHVI